jgi:hypothetical protein
VLFYITVDGSFGFDGKAGEVGETTSGFVDWLKQSKTFSCLREC